MAEKSPASTGSTSPEDDWELIQVCNRERDDEESDDGFTLVRPDVDQGEKEAVATSVDAAKSLGAIPKRRTRTISLPPASTCSTTSMSRRELDLHYHNQAIKAAVEWIRANADQIDSTDRGARETSRYESVANKQERLEQRRDKYWMFHTTGRTREETERAFPEARIERLREEEEDR